MIPPTLDQLRVLAAVAETNSFGQAAIRLNRVQSAISQTIAKLEQQLGFRLFERGSRPVRVTAEGKAVLEDAYLVIRKAQDLSIRAESFRSGVEPRLTLCVDSLFPRHVLAFALSAVSSKFPAVVFDLVSLEEADPIQQVASGRADLGIGLMQGEIPGTLSFLRLPSVRLWSVVAPPHPLARLRGGFRDVELSEHVEIHVTDATRIWRGSKTRSRSARAWRVVDVETARALILAGIGWGLLPEYAIAEDLNLSRLIAIVPSSRSRDGTSESPTFAITRNDRPVGPALSALLHELASTPPKQAEHARAKRRGGRRSQAPSRKKF